MNRSELIRRFILNQIADDYEEIDYITGNVTTWARKCSVDVGRPEVVQELMNLIDAGLARAYRLFTTKRSVEEFDGKPPLEEMEESRGGYTYFWITETGLEFHGSRDDWWPFDDNDLLRQDWSLTE